MTTDDPSHLHHLRIRDRRAAPTSTSACRSVARAASSADPCLCSYDVLEEARSVADAACPLAVEPSDRPIRGRCGGSSRACPAI